MYIYFYAKPTKGNTLTTIMIKYYILPYGCTLHIKYLAPLKKSSLKFYIFNCKNNKEMLEMDFLALAAPWLTQKF